MDNIFQYIHCLCIISSSWVIRPEVHFSILIHDPLRAWNWCWKTVISIEIIPSRNLRQPILSWERPIDQNLCGASWTTSSIVTVPRCCTYSTILSAKSGLVSAASNHRSRADGASQNFSTLPSMGHSRMFSAISTLIVQHGHLLLCLSWCYWCRFFFVAAIFITCLHAQTWNSRGTFLFKVWCTWGQSTLLNALVNSLDVLWKKEHVTCHPAMCLMWAPVSEVIFLPSTNKHIGSRGNTSCCGGDWWRPRSGASPLPQHCMPHWAVLLESGPPIGCDCFGRPQHGYIPNEMRDHNS